MRDRRPVDKFFEQFSIPALRPYPLRTTVDIADDIFAGLAYFADVPEVGKDLLKSRGIPLAEMDDAFFAMRSFLRQSTAFYKVARDADPRSSSLNYYYSFLNLAKAVLCLEIPKEVSGRIHHGLSHQLTHESLDKQAISVQDHGVFPLLYKSVLGEKFPNGIVFNVLDALAYCSDISLEVETSSEKKHCMVGGLSRGLAHMPTKQASAMIALMRFDRIESCESAKKHFYEHFEEVSVEVNFARDVFRVREAVKSQVRFFELKKVLAFENDAVPILELEKECRAALGPYLLEIPYQEQDGFDFSLCCPLTTNQVIPFNQILATYAVFFFLSNLVRYYPLYFEKQFGHRDVWIIESFARSTPITLLRHLANRIFGQNRRYDTR